VASPTGNKYQHFTPSRHFSAEEFGCYPAAVLAALLASLLLLSASPVDVALDPGHSRADVGAVGGGLREYQLTLDLAERVRTRLEAAHLTVRLTREDDQPLTADTWTKPSATEQIQAEQEARIAAGGSSRVYVSLHFNGGPASLHGTETYFNAERAADTSSDLALADALQKNVVDSLAGGRGYLSLDRGVKSDLAAGKSYGHFFSLRGPVPSALVENLFLSNADDAAALRDDATLDALADGCVQGVLEYFAGAAAD
jgi:N-acetylmuramoyl-L-alanine amidase